MSIRIHTKAMHGGGAAATPPDTYFDKIVKYIPSDIVGAWVAAAGAIKGAAGIPQGRILWIAFIVGVVMTAVWKLKQTTLPLQAAISTGAFVVWVFALGGPFEQFSWYQPVYGTLLLIAYTLIAATVNPD